jgi:hypothetical protein
MSDLLKDNDVIEAQAFSKALFRSSLKLGKDEEPVNEVSAANLAADESFIEKFIGVHPEFWSELDQVGGKGKREWNPILLREEGEQANEYLLRAYQDYDKRMRETLGSLGKSISRRLSSLTGALSNPGLEALNNAASSADRIDEIIKRTSALGSVAEAARTDVFGGSAYEPFEMPELHIPPNPIHETNDHLAELTTSMNEMRHLFIEQASMQRDLNTVATEILDKFVRGSMDAAKSSRNTLIVAALAVVTSLVPFFYGITVDTNQKEQLESQERIEAVLIELKNEAQASGEEDEQRSQRLIETIESLEAAIERD